MGITVFFEETLSGDEIRMIGDRIGQEKSAMIKEMKYISAEEAWEEFVEERQRRLQALHILAELHVLSQ